MNKYIWNDDENGFPVLDTEEKLVAYATAVLHQPADINLIRFEPHSLEAVTLWHGHTLAESNAELHELMIRMKAAEEANDKEAILNAIKPMMTPRLAINLGLVNGIAADTLNDLRKNFLNHGNE